MMDREKLQKQFEAEILTMYPALCLKKADDGEYLFNQAYWMYVGWCNAKGCEIRIA